MGEQVTPARLREIAAAAEDVAARIREAHAVLRAEDDENRRRVGFRLDDAAGSCANVAEDLQATAADLARVAAIPEQACAIGWGVCPEHGNTLTGTGGRTHCRTCGRSWGYDRVTSPCPEPVTHTITDTAGTSSPVCTGHAIAAREQLTDATITTL
jgi:hypothetical protein